MDFSPHDDDGKSTLLDIARRSHQSIMTSLVQIQRCQTHPENSVKFLENLECLRLGAEDKLYRHMVDAFDPQQRGYVALSYTWDPSPHWEPNGPPQTPFLVEQRATSSHRTRPSSRLRPSDVRATVLERIARYMRGIRVDLLWIDRYCITQDSERCCGAADCRRESCTHNRGGMQVMDLVYSLSCHPVALLGRPVKSPQRLTLLAKLLQGRLVSGPRRTPSLAGKTSLREAELVLHLLDDITNDHWWTRGWTFQENYLGGDRMVLLIPHPRELEAHKRRFLANRSGSLLFGQIDGELCLSSVNFHDASTRFCLALRQRLCRSKRTPPLMVRQCIDRVLARAERYTVTLERSAPMTPSIVEAIEKRNMAQRWDRLAITTNCCRYAARLNPGLVKENGHGLSLAMLTLCLLNGEILHNDSIPDRNGIGGMTVTRFLKTRSFNEIRGPSTGRNLTFNKSCRLIEPKLTSAGIETKGHFWKLGKFLDTSLYPPRPSRVVGPEGALTFDQRGYLTLLAMHLHESGHQPLSDKISRFVLDDIAMAQHHASTGTNEFVADYMLQMAFKVAEAIAKRKTLRLGTLFETGIQTQRPYMAVFVWDDWDNDGQGDDTAAPQNINANLSKASSYAFTASRPGIPGSEEHEVKDLNRHVSFEVRLEDGGPGGAMNGQVGMPSLRIERWISGICFFHGQGRIPVVFPWPVDLQSLSP